MDQIRPWHILELELLSLADDLLTLILEPVLEMFHPAFVPKPGSLRIHLFKYIL
jgi:hypothetical protein